MSAVLSAIIFVLCKISLSSLPVFSNSPSISLPVLMYHSVNPDPERTGKYVITPKNFESDLVYLKNHGFETVSLKQVIKFVYSGEPLPEKPVLITFDDGMYNCKEYVLPILERQNACAVFAVVGSYTDEYSKSNIINPAYSYLRWCDISELSKSGRIEFISHSYDMHSISKKRTGASKKRGESSLDYIPLFCRDTEKMQEACFENCNFAPYAYAYPFGSYCEESEKVLKKSGFLATLSCTEGINIITRNNPDCLYLLKRYNRDGVPTSENFLRKILPKD